MFETTLETMHSDDALIVVAGKDGDLAFWVSDIRYLEDWPVGNGGCRIHLLKGEDSCTLFSTLSVQEIAEIIGDEKVQP